MTTMLIYIFLLAIALASLLGMLGSDDEDTKKYAGQITLAVLIAVTLIRLAQLKWG